MIPLRPGRASLALVLLAMLAAGPVRAAPPLGCDRIEEDWELLIASTSTSEVGPQMTTTLSPDGDNTRTFFAFNLNYRDAPFRPGGYQVQAWNGNTLLGGPNATRSELCQTANETVTWTQRLRLVPPWIVYDVRNLTSTTWGTVASSDQLRVVLYTGQWSLAGYNPEVSVDNSGVGWQANRVDRMTLKRVRYYQGDVLLQTEDFAREVDLPPPAP